MSNFWNYINRVATTVSSNLDQTYDHANKLLKIGHLNQEILALATNMDTYSNPDKLVELKSKAEELNKLRTEVNTYCRNLFNNNSSNEPCVEVNNISNESNESNE